MFQNCFKLLMVYYLFFFFLNKKKKIKLYKNNFYKNYIIYFFLKKFKKLYIKFSYIHILNYSFYLLHIVFLNQKNKPLRQLNFFIKKKKKKIKITNNIVNLKTIYNSYLLLKKIKTIYNLLNIFFLRKNKVFNKSRYSRNRQVYRTGVYWCVYINIIVIIGVYFWFYKISINYNYLWFILYSFFFLSIYSRFINKFNIINLLVGNIKIFFFWNFFILNNFFSNIIEFLSFLKKIKIGSLIGK